jgi:GTP-binding protein EngB required for normal cell division
MISGAMLHENHQRYVLGQFKAIDKLFSEALADLNIVDDGRLFLTHLPDSTVEQRQVLADYVTQLRFVLRRFMHVEHLSDAQRPVSAVWAFRVAVSFASTAVEELRPSYLRGYGEVQSESAQAAERLVADFKVLLARMANYLERGEDAGIASRLAHLDGTADEIALLRELDRLIVEHGLVELRTPLERLVERAVHPRFEVAVFGRVNSGKTSLLNWWLGRPLLPTGVTPVTAVPTRIISGAGEQARVTLVGSSPLEIGLSRLADYVTEEGNPGNLKRVLDIELRAPAERLAEGLCLVDTPGLGSLAAVGSAQTLEYLPKCDLGILLLDAGGLIGREDIDVARAIVDGGAELIIALSKADRLSALELDRALDYARVQLSAELHFSVEVRPISTLPSQAAQAEAWFQHELAPRLAAHQEQSARALRRKIGVLRESVIALLQAQLRSISTSTHEDNEAQGAPDAVNEASSRAHAALEHARRHVSVTAFQVQSEINPIIEAGVAALIQGWSATPGDMALIERGVQAAIAGAAAAASDRMAEDLRTLRQLLQETLQQLPIPVADAEELALPRGRPLLDIAAIKLPRSLARPKGLHAFRPWIRLLARRRIERYSRASWSRQLALHSDALRHWGTQYVSELGSQWDAAIAHRVGHDRIAASGPSSSTKTNLLKHDLKRLQQWPSAQVSSGQVVPELAASHGGIDAGGGAT